MVIEHLLTGMILQGGTNSHKSHQIEMERGMLDFLSQDLARKRPPVRPNRARLTPRDEVKGADLSALRQFVLNDIV